MTRTVQPFCFPTLKASSSLLSERDLDLVVPGSLSTGVFKLPLQPCLRVVKLRHNGRHIGEINPHQLPRNLPKLKHDSHWHLPPCRLIEGLCRCIVLCEQLQADRHFTGSRRHSLCQRCSKLRRAHVDVVSNLYGRCRDGQKLIGNHTQPYLPKVSRHR